MEGPPPAAVKAEGVRVATVMDQASKKLITFRTGPDAPKAAMTMTLDKIGERHDARAGGVVIHRDDVPQCGRDIRVTEADDLLQLLLAHHLAAIRLIGSIPLKVSAHPVIHADIQIKQHQHGCL